MKEIMNTSYYAVVIGSEKCTLTPRCRLFCVQCLFTSGIKICKLFCPNIFNSSFDLLYWERERERKCVRAAKNHSLKWSQKCNGHNNFLCEISNYSLKTICNARIKKHFHQSSGLQVHFRVPLAPERSTLKELSIVFCISLMLSARRTSC